MSAVPEQIGPSEIEWPPTLRAELDVTRPPRRPWTVGLGPAYLTIFAWAPFFDPLWRHDLTRAGPAWLAGSAVLGVLLCFGLFYYPAAIWGYRTGRGLGVVAASTFGVVGSDWLTGVALAAGEIVWFAVAIDYGIQATFLGLVAAGLLPPAVLAHWPVGTALLRNPIFLGTALFWIFITGMAGLLRLTGVIGALMKVYSPVALVLLTFSAIWALPGLSAFSIDPSAAARTFPARLSAIPIMTGFFAMVGLMSVDWGAASERRRDVVVGGLLGIVLAGTWAAVMSLLAVAGAIGRLRAARSVELTSIPSLPVYSFRWAVFHGIGGTTAGVILVLLGLAALAPACFSSFVFVRKLFARWPRVRRIDWGWIGCTLAFALIVTGWPGRLEAVDHIMGLVFAPAAGAMAGDFLGHRGRWAGVRPGVHPPGAIAWAVGLGIRPIVDSLAATGRLPVPSLLASPVAGFLAAAFVYRVMARMGMERPATPVEGR